MLVKLEILEIYMTLKTQIYADACKCHAELLDTMLPKYILDTNTCIVKLLTFSILNIKAFRHIDLVSRL